MALVPGRLMSVNIGHRGPTTGKNKNQSKVGYVPFSSLDVSSGRLIGMTSVEIFFPDCLCRNDNKRRAACKVE